MYNDDFDCQIQIEEIIPEEYEDWLNGLNKEYTDSWLQTLAEEYADKMWEDEATSEFEPGRTYWNQMAANP